MAALLLALPATAETFGPVAWSADGGGVSATFGGATFRAASAAPTADLPLPGIPMSTRFVISRRSCARMRSFSRSAMGLSKKCSSAALACATSIGRPSERGMPNASACSNSAVRRGL